MGKNPESSLTRRFRLFGTRKQTSILILIGMLEESYSSEIARLAGVKISTVQNYVQAMELSGVLVTRPIGKERRISLNPRFFAINELKSLLEKLSIAEPELNERVSRVRRRPRRMGKPLRPISEELRR